MPLPLYHQIYTVLREQILEGKYSTDRPLPSEFELAHQFNVSRVTIRSTLQRLASEGLISREKGRGTFARPPLASRPAEANLRGFMENLIQLGLRTKQKVLEFEYVRPPEDIRRKLALPSGALVQKAVRLSRYKDGVFSYVTTYLREEIGRTFTRKDIQITPMLTLIERAGVKMSRADQIVTARLADATMAKLLDVAVGSALISMTRTVHDDHGRPIEVVQGLYRPDRYEFQISIVRDQAKQDGIWKAAPYGTALH